MVKCPNCGSTAQPFIEDVNFEYDETTASVMYSYRCGCGKRYSTITIYETEKGEQLIEEKEEEGDE